jgi:hypothetical protein
MNIDVIVHAGSDDAFIAWTADFIPDCRGFALRRRVKRGGNSARSPNTVAEPDAQGFVEEIVASWVGFAAGPQPREGTREPTTIWPIQKYLWSDFAVRSGDAAYKVSPMLGSWNALQEQSNLASQWSDTVAIGEQADGNMSCYFNRGIVASQWLARLLPSLPDSKEDTSAKGSELSKIIASPGNPVRDFLSGPLREKLVALLNDSNAAKGHVYAALFELDDPELIGLLAAFGKRAHVLLGNGSVKKKGEDENADARRRIKGFAMCTIASRRRARSPITSSSSSAIPAGSRRRHGPAARTGPRAACVLRRTMGC